LATKPELFIVESLDLEDEVQGRQEGEILARMLKLSGKTDTRYYYIRTERELDEIIDLFDDSDYRYLHISCHANKRGMATTFDSVSYASLGEKLNDCLEGRRVFVSACEMANDTLAAELLKETGCYSLIGPAAKINFDDSAAFWITFYHLMFKVDDRRMKHRNVEFYVKELSTLFNEPVNYFRHDESIAKGYRRIGKKPSSQ
jgi:hypothetical protein